MKTDNPIEEIWRIREEIAAENGYDVDRLFDAMQREQEKYADRLVSIMCRAAPRRNPVPSCVRNRQRPTDPSLHGKAGRKIG
jgi:hypothetical protein